MGLAATQIGLGLALAVVEDHVCEGDDGDPREAAEFPFHAIINPSYEPIGTETRSFYEGCLSFDGYQAVRKRWLNITGSTLQPAGKMKTANSTRSICTAGRPASSSMKPTI